MRYISTRGDAPSLDFEDVTLTGLASDGGLYVPEAWPHFTEAEIAALGGLSYVDTAVAVMRPFVQGSLDPAELSCPAASLSTMMSRNDCGALVHSAPCVFARPAPTAQRSPSLKMPEEGS